MEEISLADTLSIHRACREEGFLLLRETGVDPHLIQSTLQETKDFFALPHAQKCENLATPENHWSGFRPMGSEAGTDQHPERCESYKVGHTVNHQGEPILLDDSKLTPTLRNYWWQMTRLSQEMKQIFAYNLLRPLDAFETTQTMDQLGLHYYPGTDKNERALSAHVDLTLFTFIVQGSEALEVLNTDDQWVTIPARPGSITVLLGEYISKISNDIYRAPEHRVRGTSEDRYALVFKQRPDYRAEFRLPNGDSYRPGLAYEKKIKRIMGYDEQRT